MIRVWIPGFSRPTKGEVRYGDAQVVTDGKYHLVIDGGCDKGTDALISYLKRNKMNNVYLAISHAHYDHWYGIKKIIRDDYFTVKGLYCYDPKTLESGLRNNKGSIEVKSDIVAMTNVINEAKNKNIKVTYVKHGSKINLGDIKINVYRKQPSYVTNEDTEGWMYINDGSLCFYFPQLYYWTSGDGSAKIWDFIKSLNIKVKFFKIPHHGNNCSESQAKGLMNHGAIYCWYNDLEANGVGTNDFTLYGARRCKQAGIHVFECVGDINFICKNGYLTIYKGGKKYSFTIPYKGESSLKNTSVNIIRKVFEGKYNNGDYRTTRVIDAGYYPLVVQQKVDLVVSVAQQIITGTLNFGKHKERINNLDKKYGKGYGQLIQDEIESLMNSKAKKW